MNFTNISIKNPINKMNGYFEFDYKHPASKQRVRRKVEATSLQAELLKNLLETVINQNMDFEAAVSFVRTNNFYSSSAAYFEDKIQELYFKYHDANEIPYALERDEAKNNLLDSRFPLSDYKANFCFLGKAGVGKSTLIKKMSPFWGKELSFPFTDTSRTSTFPSDYCFVPKSHNFKFLAILTPPTVIDLNIDECINRAINKLLEYKVHKTTKQSIIDEVIISFTSDPKQSFDIRYSLGKYIKTTSPVYSDPSNNNLISFWNHLYDSFVAIAENVMLSTKERDDDDISFYQLKYSDAIKQADNDNPIFASYLNTCELIKKQMVKTQTELIHNLEFNDSITNVEYDLNDEEVPYFSCNIKDINDETFYIFIRAFTAKKSSEFGHSLFNIVDHLRIELPLNKTILLPQANFSFVVQDTIGIAHANDGNGGFENSTHLRMEGVDSVILVDDARMNGDNNMSSILSHLLARIAPSKIHFAFTFFDDLTKSDFDEDDSLDEQRMAYLITTETNTIRSIVKDESKLKILLDTLNNNSFFMSKLMENDFNSINHLLETVILQKIRLMNNFQLFKPDPNKPFIIYDYKKLPILYYHAIEAYTKQQYNIYELSPPHYKTTEALTNRLAHGITFFSGARILRPVDDLYDLLIQTMSDYIENPDHINFAAKSDADEKHFLGILKTKITEAMRLSLNAKFFRGNMLNEWKHLYNLSGTGCDKIRRHGIMKAEKTIAPGIDAYLNSTVKEHLIDILEKDFKSSIEFVEHQLELDT